MFIVTLLEACLTFVRRRCFRALYGAGVGKSRRRPRAPAPDTAPQTTPTPALPVIIHKHYVIGPETPGDATPRPPEQSGAQRTIFAAPQSETLSAWERLADDDEPFDDGEPLDDLPDDVTEQERAEIERFDLNRYRADYAALSATDKLVSNPEQRIHEPYPQPVRPAFHPYDIHTSFNPKSDKT